MKRIVYKVTALFLVLSLPFVAASCSEEKSARELLDIFVREYGISGKCFYSDAKEGEGAAIDGELLSLMYLESPSFDEMSLFLNSKLDSVYECGIFLVSSDCGRLMLFRILSERLDFLEVNSPGAERFIMKRGWFCVYGYLPSAERAMEIFEKII